MNNYILVHVLIFYGVFLITCGIVSVIFIGLKAKTALLSGGMSGVISLVIAYCIFNKIQGMQITGLIFNFALFIVFSWRATKTLFKIFGNNNCVFVKLCPTLHEISESENFNINVLFK